MSIRPLTKELQVKATKELNENPKRIEKDIDHLKKWLSKQKHLKARADDQWLLTFLRGCKFSLEKTKEKLDMYYTMRTILPELFENRDPFSPKIQEILTHGVLLPLKTPIGPDSPKVLLMRSGITDPSKISMLDIFRTNMMILDILLREDDHFIITGTVLLHDMAGATMALFLSTSLITIKKAMKCFQEAYPHRPKAIHLYNIQSFFEKVYGMIRPFLKEKMQKRLVVHRSGDIEDLYKFIPKHVLPAEYGGNGGPIQDEIDYWKNKVESYAEWFKEDEKNYGSDESLRSGKPKTSSNLFGVEGSFRKLDVD